MITIKPGVNITGLHPQMQLPLELVTLYFAEDKLNARLTSAFRTPEVNKKVGGHPKSKHLIGKAIDIGIKELSLTDAHRIYIKLKTSLEQNDVYKVIMAKKYIHIQYQL